MSQTKLTKDEVTISEIIEKSDFAATYDIACQCFGVQSPDALHAAFNPAWQTPEGRQKGIDRTANRLDKISLDKHGRPNSIFLKATVPNPDPTTKNDSIDKNGRKIVGFAYWSQVSCVEGYGDAPKDDFVEMLDLRTLHAGDPGMQAFLSQALMSLTRARHQLAKEKVNATSCAIMGLDLICVDPKFQGLGIGAKLVNWGLEEAKKRGDLECVLEGSTARRGLYKKLGFVQVGGEIGYEDVEDKDYVKGLKLPSNVFMRTRPEVP